MGVLSQYIQSIYQLHWIDACCILWYLKRASGKELYYHHSSHLDIMWYCDADWADNFIDRHSTIDYCTYFRDNLVTWWCKKKCHCSIQYWGWV